MLPDRENRTLWNLNLTDLGKVVEARDGFDEVRIGYLQSLRDDEVHQIYNDELIVQHLKRTAVIDGQDCEIWLSSTVRREYYK